MAEVFFIVRLRNLVVGIPTYGTISRGLYASVMLYVK
ncbi:unnamed protein product [Tuber melanosporum]|uniref:(Perigord truffle) hypothetical protein n=1 Tax=Tuber melanosporum (strain Mel28) TaxID=656061 RepID=D5GGM1_TUBMM|nr:uncharacterized protein GSTUM_00007416001 [Tuber melanosporum]CAZ83643.1 unnamed protein product [Tuber melanosporum]